MRVAVAPNMGCGQCGLCVSGNTHLCHDYRALGIHVDGGFAEYVRIPAAAVRQGNVVEIGPRTTFAEAALAEPLSCTYNGFERCAIGPGDKVLIMGAGPIGLAAIALAKAAGAGMIVAFEVSPVRLALAEQVGADFAYDPGEVSAGDVLMELSKGAGFDFHVEAAGVPHLVIPEMEKALAINGKVVQIGRAAQRVLTYLEAFQVRRSQVYGAQGHSGHETFPNVLRMVSAGRLDLSEIITARYKLEDTVDAIVKSGDRTDGKILVKPN